MNEIKFLDPLIRSFEKLPGVGQKTATRYAFQVVEKLSEEELAKEGIDARVIDIHTIKPFDEEIIIKAATECGKIVTAEEHSVIGGLGSAVCDCLSEKCPTPVKKLGMQDVFGESGPAVKLLEKYKLDGNGVYEQIKAWL